MWIIVEVGIDCTSYYYYFCPNINYIYRERRRMGGGLVEWLICVVD